MRIATVISTYNRAASLRRALATLVDVERLPNVAWEVVVVDNHPFDNTQEVCREFEGLLPIRYLAEPRRGKSNGLNTAIRSTTADLFLFTDDDVDVDPLWLKGFADAAERLPDVPFFAGRILARLEGNPPAWFAEYADSILSQVAVHYDPGDAEQHVSAAFGANMAIRAEIFREGFSFRCDLGPSDTKGLRSEEMQLFQDIMLSRGVREDLGFYVPAALVFHRTNRSRMTEAYVREWYYGDGIARARRNQIDPGKELFQIPQYLWRKLIESAMRYAILRPFAPARMWLLQEIEMARVWGIITELRRMKKREAR